jgi:hypothetical protein
VKELLNLTARLFLYGFEMKTDKQVLGEALFLFHWNNQTALSALLLPFHQFSEIQLQHQTLILQYGNSSEVQSLSNS